MARNLLGVILSLHIHRVLTVSYEYDYSVQLSTVSARPNEY